MLQLFLVMFVYIRCFVECWRLDVLGLDESKIKLSSIVVYGGRRAFVSIPRAYIHQKVTLAELPWPERSLYTPSNTKAFPDLQSQILTEHNCTKLQSALTLDIDPRGRLYVLDRGFEDCPAKIIVFDTITSKELIQFDILDVPVENLKSLIVDVNPRTLDVRVILGDAGNNSLLVYSVKQNIWWKMTVVKKFHFDENFMLPMDHSPVQLSFNQLAISKTTSISYATSSQAAEIYSIDLLISYTVSAMFSLSF